MSRSFLAQLFRSAAPASTGARYTVHNQTRGSILAPSAEIADTAAARSRGLLGRSSMPLGEALWIVPCESVHTFGMQFALDLVYLDRKLRVVKIRAAVPPWRVSLCLRAHSILELPAGSVLPGSLAPGDQLAIVPHADSVQPRNP